MVWYIIMCPYCGLLQIVRAGQKTRKCFKCGKTVKLDYSKVRVVYKSDNIRDVNYILLKLKEKQIMRK